MKEFMGKDFLLSNETAKHLYHDYAEKMPIIDYHCHISQKEIYDNKQFSTITEVWLGGDHYKWRQMRANGIDEKYITGDASDLDKFKAWAKTLSHLIGNPLYHWSHLELQRYFGIYEPLTEDNAEEIFNKCNEVFIVQKFLSFRIKIPTMINICWIFIIDKIIIIPFINIYIHRGVF